MTKLLLITSEFPPQPGGIGNHAHHVARSLLPHGFEVTVLADQRSHSGDEENEFDQLQHYKVVRVQRRKLMCITYLERIYQTILLTKRHDVLLVSGKFSLWIAGLLRFVTVKKIVAVIHGSEVALPPSIKKRFTAWSLRRCNEVIAVSSYTKSLVADWKLKQVAVIPNGFSITTQPSARRQQSKQLRLITVGNVTQRKGQHNMVKALPTLLEHFPQLHYDVVGIPTEKQTVEKLAKQLEVAQHVIFHGQVSEEKKQVLLEQATIFVMLSEATPEGDVEGFGIAILEGNALGLPAIGSLGCGIEDAISPQLSGVLIDPKNPMQLVKAVVAILDDYERYSTDAKKWSQGFTWDKISTQYATILNS